ncbi:MAG: hypothetical protein ACXQTN_07230 [Methanoculleaceae archaeon]
MQAPDRDRCGPVIIACALAVILWTSPTLALDAVFRVAPDGESVTAEYILDNNTCISLVRPGLLGEPVPVEAENITLTGTDQTIEPLGMGRYAVPGDARSLRFTAPLNGNTIQILFDQPSNVTLYLPERYMLGNPALTTIRPPAELQMVGGESVVKWNGVRYIECRFYERMQEIMLYTFGGLWIAVTSVLLFGYLLVSRRRP